MSLSPETARSFVALMPSLAPGADVGGMVKFFHEHAESLHASVAEIPGHDRIRAGLLRLLPALGLGDEERDGWIRGASLAMDAYEPEDRPGSLALRRPPAWVGLCILELKELQGGDPAGALAEAVALATRGFVAPGDSPAVGEGEVLWALSEAAAEVGWTDRADFLLEAAAQAPFDDPHNRGRVWLLRIFAGLDRDEDVDGDVAKLLAEDLDPQTRVQGLWIGAIRDRAADRIARSIERLQEATELVDAQEEPEIAARIREMLQALGVRPDGAAEA